MYYLYLILVGLIILAGLNEIGKRTGYSGTIRSYELRHRDNKGSIFDGHLERVI